ncbi:MAG: transposase, partial [Planctomycetaceae bacterium]|nr:transposase [Planctomycetaceae bacterium]
SEALLFLFPSSVSSRSAYDLPNCEVREAELRETCSQAEPGNKEVSRIWRLFMSRSRYRIFETEFPYFCTCTIVGWLPVFTRREAVQIVFDSWKYLQQERQFQIFGYVILENHLHLIAKAPDLPDVLHRFKSYTAREIIELLKRRSARVLLSQLKHHKLRHKTDSEYQVWQEGSHPEQIQGDEMMWQKLGYVQNNPVERGYVDDPLHWRYSSARNYARQPGLIDVMTTWM